MNMENGTVERCAVHRRREMLPRVAIGVRRTRLVARGNAAAFQPYINAFRPRKRPRSCRAGASPSSVGSPKPRDAIFYRRLDARNSPYLHRLIVAKCRKVLNNKYDVLLLRAYLQPRWTETACFS